MASKNVRHALTIIGLAHGLADSIEQSYSDGAPKTVRSMTDSVRARCHECFNLWPDKLDKREIKRINDRMNVLDIVVREAHGSAAAYTSMALALLSDLHDVVGTRKRQAISRLLSVCQRLHRYYDRRLDRWQDYDAARDAVMAMYQRQS